MAQPLKHPQSESALYKRLRENLLHVYNRMRRPLKIIIKQKFKRHLSLNDETACFVIG